MSDSDARPLLHQSFDQAARVLRAVTAEQLTSPTPCSEFDVAALLRHLAGVGHRIVGIGLGVQQASELPPVPEGLSPAEMSATFDAARERARSAWADDEILERKIELPFGTFTGATVAQIYFLELTVHTWDLASATGQRATLDDNLAEATLPIAQGVLPPEPRGGFIPFERVIPVPEEASAYQRLAGYLGRSVA
jgi:uncharacterized protein (TIGR03086 family)